MPGETTHYKFKYAKALDETKAFPAEVDQPKTEAIDTLLFEKNLGSIQVAAGAVYGARTARVVGTEYEPSATRPVLVVADVEPQPTTATGAGAKFFVGAVEVAEVFQQKAATLNDSDARQSVTFIVPAGVKWRCVSVTEAATSLHSSYLTL